MAITYLEFLQRLKVAAEDDGGLYAAVGLPLDEEAVPYVLAHRAAYAAHLPVDEESGDDRNDPIVLAVATHQQDAPGKVSVIELMLVTERAWQHIDKKHN